MKRYHNTTSKIINYLVCNLFHLLTLKNHSCTISEHFMHNFLLHRVLQKKNDKYILFLLSLLTTSFLLHWRTDTKYFQNLGFQRYFFKF